MEFHVLSKQLFNNLHNIEQLISTSAQHNKCHRSIEILKKWSSITSIHLKLLKHNIWIRIDTSKCTFSSFIQKWAFPQTSQTFAITCNIYVTVSLPSSLEFFFHLSFIHFNFWFMNAWIICLSALQSFAHSLNAINFSSCSLNKTLIEIVSSNKGQTDTPNSFRQLQIQIQYFNNLIWFLNIPWQISNVAKIFLAGFFEEFINNATT